MPEVILETRGITKSYHMSGGKEIAVLEDINIQIKSGEFVSILGPSGAGKSTLLRILAGLSTPSRGEVLCHDVPLKFTKPKFAMVFQGFALFPWLTVLRNVELGLKSYRLPDKEIKEKARFSCLTGR